MPRRLHITTKSQQKINPVDFKEYRNLPVNLLSTIDIDDPKINPGAILKSSCDFDYLGEKISFTFTSGHVLWKPKISSFYFKNQSLTTVRGTDKSFKIKELCTNVISFRNVSIDFFGFSNERIFKAVIDFESPQMPRRRFRSTFTVALPVLKFKEMEFGRPKIKFPSQDVQTVCRQGFKMDNHNSNAQIMICINLEEFKLLPITTRYRVHGYCDMLNLFIDIENSFELELINKLDIFYAKLQRLSEIRFKIETKNPIPSAATSVLLTPNSINSLKNKNQVNARIVGYHQKFITVEVSRQKIKTFDHTLSYHVRFLTDLYTSAMAQRALHQIQKTNFEDFLLNFNKISTKNFPQFSEIEFLNTAVGQNQAQSQAVHRIVNRTSFPSPYIVFGPPGTGKTSTLVEAVAQIVKLLPAARILVTVNSNSACDEIAERLLSHVGANKIYRFYSPSFAKKMDRVHNKLKPISNLRYGYHVQPSAQELTSYNVLIATLVNSGRLQGLDFDFIFIDECASSAEVFVDIPLTLATKMKTALVLLGDPKQLGQIMRTFHNERFGFNISLMERVMDLDEYKFPFNPNRITQLTDNFRSHRSILDFSNQAFYNSILKAKQVEKIANFAVGWEMLPNKKVPLIFHASWTPSEVDGTSQFNCGDIAIVRNYVGNLLRNGVNGTKVKAKDIGIISPYAAQRERLKIVYPEGIEIGTVEYFQGREKLIVIVSSVRSKTATVGFLKNEKRLNVALTRAKALLIVIGNPETLGKSSFWKKFIGSCCEKGATVGKVPGWVWRKEEKPDEDSENDDDQVIRLEEMMNGLGLEE